MCDLHPQSERQQGFSLIELTIVLLVVGLLLGAVMMPLATQYRIRETRTAQQQIEEVRQALIGFAQSQGRLPCPDTAGFDGLEDGPAPGCGNTTGFLPYATIGLSPTDPWGHLFIYRVATEFTNTVLPGTPCVGTGSGDNQLGICDNGNIAVSTRDDAKNLNPIATNAAAMIVSFGPNGYCGRTLNGTQKPPATGTCPTTNVTTSATVPDEFENSDTDGTVVSRTYTSGGSGCDDTDGTKIFCEFDDLVVWIPTSLLLGKLIEAGQLP